MASDPELEHDAVQPQRLAPADVQQVQFRRSFRGYDEQEVDDFLDRITEELSLLLDEKRAMTEQADRLPTVPAQSVGDLAGAQRAADDIKRRAHEEAEAVVREAKQRADALMTQARARLEETVQAQGRVEPAPAPAPPSSTAGLGAFVSQEREFLQRLASLIQDHASSVKDLVQTARTRQATSGPGSSAADTAGPGTPAAGAASDAPAAGATDLTPPPAQQGPGRGPGTGPQVGGPVASRGDGAAEGVVRLPDAEPGSTSRPGASIDWDRASRSDAGTPPPPPPPPQALREPLPRGSLFPEAEPGTGLQAGSPLPRSSPARHAREDLPPSPPAGRAPDGSLRELFWGEDSN